MEMKQKVLEFRDRLDKTLASPNLANEESIKSLVRNQLLRSSSCETEGDVEHVVRRRTMEVSNFLEMSRSVSGTHGTSRGDWKLKQDNDEVRVMYREGPEGSPFHTLLVEGYVDGPIDVCLCVAWESTLFNKWWPQFSIPPFKIVQSTCLKQVRIGEEISLVRVKVPWPVSAREAIVHFFELDYFEDDLIIVLINTVSDKEHIDVHTHGFTSDGIPEAKDIVRIDVAGAMALQKVSSNKSYFRTIANFDVKLDFIPATFINFVSRQLIGSGFKLYQKKVASVANGDVDFRKALEEKAMYTRIRESLKSHDKGKDPKVLDYESSTSDLTEEHTFEMVHADTSVDIKSTMVSETEDETEQVDHLEVDQLMHHSSMNEIAKQHHEIEDETEQGEHLEVDQLMHHSSTNEIAKQHHEIEDETEQVDHLEVDQLLRHSSMNEIAEQRHVCKEGYFISSEVEQALSILDKAIALVRGCGQNGDCRIELSSTKQKIVNLDRIGRSCSTSSDEAWVSFDAGDAPNVDDMDKPSDKTHDDSTIHNFRDADTDLPSSEADNSQKESADTDLPSSEADNSQKESASPNSNHTISNKIQEGVLSSSHNGMTNTSMLVAPMPQSINGVHKIVEIRGNGAHESSVNGINEKYKQKKNKKRRICCLL